MIQKNKTKRFPNTKKYAQLLCLEKFRGARKGTSLNFGFGQGRYSHLPRLKIQDGKVTRGEVRITEATLKHPTRRLEINRENANVLLGVQGESSAHV